MRPRYFHSLDVLLFTEAYSEHSRKSQTKLFAKIVLKAERKSYILDIRLGSACASGLVNIFTKIYKDYFIIYTCK